MNIDELRKLYLEQRTNLSTLDLMVAAYNRALDDAVKVGEGDPYIYVWDIEKLKISD